MTISPPHCASPLIPSEPLPLPHSPPYFHGTSGYITEENYFLTLFLMHLKNGIKTKGTQENDKQPTILKYHGLGQEITLKEKTCCCFFFH